MTRTCQHPIYTFFMKAKIKEIGKPGLQEYEKFSGFLTFHFPYSQFMHPAL